MHTILQSLRSARIHKSYAMDVTQSYVSVGVNRVVNALDWGPDGLVAYGAHNMVVVYDPEVGGVFQTHELHAC